jgi:gamma-glutamylcyclotransferase (GGCT)/AIG2-like uncharacterized protein YtfP
MCTMRLRRRVQSAVAQGVGWLGEHQLRVHKRGKDGSAKADAFRTADAADRVWGVLYEIDPAHKADLDGFEGLGSGYSEGIVDVHAADRTLRAQIYLAQRSAITPGLLPYSWYVRYILAGAIEHRLPADYVARIRQIASTEDPDPARHAREWIADLPGE